MAYVVYLLCSLMSFTCAVILFRAYWKSRSRLLLWSSVCFTGIALNNILLSVDFSLGPTYDLSTYRAFLGMIAMGALMYGLIWDTV